MRRDMVWHLEGHVPGGPHTGCKSTKIDQLSRASEKADCLNRDTVSESKSEEERKSLP